MAEACAGVPLRPADVGEWEELLVRFELAPRALRLALDAVPGGIDDAAVAPAAVAARLRRLAEREAEAWAWLQCMAEAGASPPAAPAGSHGAEHGGSAPEPLRAPLDRFAGLRARNFAWVQRRGLDVWEWRADHPVTGPVTAFQLISVLVRGDGAEIRAIRRMLGERQPC